MVSTLHIFGIRHHGPGSARSLERALTELSPDLVLIEGPPEADEIMSQLAHEEMQPPVALLVYDPESPQRAAFYPFAEFSPETVAIRWAARANVPARFMDLPVAHSFALQTLAEAKQEVSAPETKVSVAVTKVSEAGTFVTAAETKVTATETKVTATETKVTATETKVTATETKVAASETFVTAAVERFTAAVDLSATAVDLSATAVDLSATAVERFTAAVGTLATAARIGSVTAQTPADAEPSPVVENEDVALARSIRADPLGVLATVAGYSDSEMWWEDMVEHRQDGTALFQAVLEAMSALREEVARLEADARTDTFPLGLDPEREEQREAWMRATIRAAQKDGFARIAVVCGAWHAPVLTDGDAKKDAATLKNLPKTKVQATWIPWTNGRLCSASGYGAGVSSPGWYGHLWECDGLRAEAVSTRWLARVAGLLRAEGLDISSAHIIEAARLCESLAALRARPLPGLPEIEEAIRAVLLFGDDLPLKLIHEKLVVGETLGAVPTDTPMVPLQRDLGREQKRLRLPPEAAQKTLDLDLRREVDLSRSHLLHRLRALGVAWGEPRRHNSGKGTFHELWDLAWKPEFELSLIEAGVWGNTVLDAATTRACDQAGRAPDLPSLTELLDASLLADLPRASEAVVERLQAEAAVASDIAHLMGALPPLCRVLRYGNVRGTAPRQVAPVVDGLVARVGVGLSPSCASLDSEAADKMFALINNVHAALSLTQNLEHAATWHSALLSVANRETAHGLVAGRAVRLLLDADAMIGDEAARRLSLALSTASEPAQAASWAQGFLGGSGELLLHDERVWGAFDGWMSGLSGEAFQTLLPLLRRTFGEFSAPERRAMGERARDGAATTRRSRSVPTEIDESRARLVLPVVARLLGLAHAKENDE